MKVFPDCEECPSDCPLGGWNGGTCGAQHIGLKDEECNGAYQFASKSPNGCSYNFKCDICGDIRTESAAHYE